MTVVLDHLIVRARAGLRSAQFLAGLLGTSVGERVGPFVPVAINGDLTLDFDDRHEFVAGHYAFLVDDETLARAIDFVRSEGAEYGSGLGKGWDRQVGVESHGRRVYVRDPDGHSYELLTRN